MLVFLISLQVSSEAVQKKAIKVGILTLSGTTEQEFQEGFEKFQEFIASNIKTSGDHFVNSFTDENWDIKFYDSLMSLLMALKSGKIDEIILPETVGKYVMNFNGAYEQKFLINILSSSLSFGFREGSEELQNEFNRIITEMKNDGTFDRLVEEYIKNFNNSDVKSITPEKFEDAPSIKVAVTGDMPPIDMFAGDGKPAGYNTAVLAEIGRRLKKNIQLISINAGGRSAALASEKADVVFWYRTTESSIEGVDPLDEIFKDASDGVILSIPYYSWNEEIIIITKHKKRIFDLFK